MNSAEKYIQLNLNNEAKQAKRKVEEQAAYERIHSTKENLARISAERK